MHVSAVVSIACSMNKSRQEYDESLLTESQQVKQPVGILKVVNSCTNYATGPQRSGGQLSPV